MRLLDLIKLSLRMFKARTMRTILTVLGMSVGISAILILVSLGYGLQKTILERITTADSLATLDVSAGEPGSPDLTPDLVSQLEHINGVAEVSPSVQLQAQGKVNNITMDIGAIATTPIFFRLNGTRAASGQLLSATQSETAVITTSMANVFGKTPEEIVGQTFQLAIFPQQNTGDKTAAKITNQQSALKTYTIVGIVEGDENTAYVALDTIDTGLFIHYDQLKVKSSSTDIMPGVRDTLTQMKLSVSSLSETIDQANKVFQILQFILMIFGVIALIVSAIGMFNTMTIALLERTEEIGIMKSIGASHRAISLMFIVEATLMGFLGSIGGVLMGYGTGQIFNMLLNFVAQRFGGQAMQLFYSPLWFVSLIILFGSAVGLMTGVLPARKASRIDPLEALRYK